MIGNWRPWCTKAILLLTSALSLQASDLLLTQGHIFTGNPKQPWAQAIAISGGRIDAVGSDEEIARRKEAKTKVLDLQGRTGIPGMIDSHTHLWMGALALHGFNLATPEVYIEPKDEAAFLSKIREYAAAHPQDKVLFGRVQFPRDATHELLDRAVPDRPVVIHAPTEHEYWVNAKALALAGITEKPNADAEMEKFIVRDKSGKPTGILRDAAMVLMERALPKQPLREKMEWMREATRYLNRFGITSVTNASGDSSELEIYDGLRDRGELTVRVRMAFANVGKKHSLTPRFLAELERARKTYSDSWVSANLVKFFSDGAGGPPLYEPAEFKALIAELDKRGFQIMTHAIGAGPARMVVDAYEELSKANGPRDRRLRMEHAMNVPLPEVARMGKLGVSASMQPAFCCFNDRPEAPSNVWQTMTKNAVNVAFGSDWPCSWPPSPMESIQQAVERQLRQLFTAPNPKAVPSFVSAGERLSVEQAVAAYTRAGAYARFSENQIGSLEPGKEADLVVISNDIFAAKPEEIGKTRVLLTMVGGKTVFDAR